MSSATCLTMFVLGAVVPLLPAAPENKPAPPKIMLWSWYAEDDFRFLKSPDIGVAYLALSLTLSGRDEVTPYPRAVPVRIPPHTWQTAVIRFDFDSYGARRPAFTEQQRKLAVKMI